MSQDEKNINQLITNIFKKNNKLAKAYNSYNIEQIWRDTFGAMISSHTTHVKFMNGKLTVFINSAPLKQEIELNKAQVIEKLNKVLKYKKVDTLYVR